MKFILAVLLGILAYALAQTQTCPDLNAPRTIHPDPNDCSRYTICIFGRPTLFLCPPHIPHFNACILECTISNNTCHTCVDTTTTTQITTTQAGITTTTSQDVPTPPIETTTTVTTTTTEEPTFIPTPPPETTPGPDTTTTTTVAGDTTLSVPTAPVVPPTPPVNP